MDVCGCLHDLCGCLVDVCGCLVDFCGLLVDVSVFVDISVFLLMSNGFLDVWCICCENCRNVVGV